MLGYPFRVIGLAESKRSAQKVLMLNWSNKCDHMFEDNAVFLQESHKCFLHGRTCRREQQRPDVSSGGFECQAYSHMRSRMGKTERTDQMQDGQDRQDGRDGQSGETA